MDRSRAYLCGPSLTRPWRSGKIGTIAQPSFHALARPAMPRKSVVAYTRMVVRGLGAEICVVKNGTRQVISGRRVPKHPDNYPQAGPLTPGKAAYWVYLEVVRGLPYSLSCAKRVIGRTSRRWRRGGRSGGSRAGVPGHRDRNVSTAARFPPKTFSGFEVSALSHFNGSITHRSGF